MNNEKKRYSAADCEESGSNAAIMGRVVIVSADALPEKSAGQIFYCMAGQSAGLKEKHMLAVSLENGQWYGILRSAVTGTLKPELLTDDARLHLSQVRPLTAKIPEGVPDYTGFCFLPNGCYCSGVAFENVKDAMDYVEMQKPFQHRILLCDSEDFAVLEVVDGRLIYPTSEILEAARDSGNKQEPAGGIDMSM